MTETGLPAPVRFGLYSYPQSTGDGQLAASQLQANAARAVEAGLGRMRGEAPPPLYAFDPDIGRLAITTPTYNTAIIAVNQRAFPYGGIELARLFDADQDVAANIGGRAPSAFGLLVRTPSGAPVFASQTGRARVDPKVTSVRLTRAPTGTSHRTEQPGQCSPAPSAESARAVSSPPGAFEPSPPIASPRRSSTPIGALTASEGARASARTSPSRAGDATPASPPSCATGRASASAPAGRWRWPPSSGSRSRARGAATPSRRCAGREGAIAHVILPSRQSSQPDPGPTLAVELARGAQWSRARFAARIRVHPR